MDIYKEHIRRCAPEYDSLTVKAEKTAYVSDLVNNFINDGFLFIQKNGDDYLLYNMENDKAFKKVRGKIRQALRDFLRNTRDYKWLKALSGLPDISIVEFQSEGPPLPGKDLIDVFNTPLEPEIEQVLDNMAVSSEEGEAFDLDEDMDDLSFSDFPMID